MINFINIPQFQIVNTPVMNSPKTHKARVMQEADECTKCIAYQQIIRYLDHSQVSTLEKKFADDQQLLRILRSTIQGRFIRGNQFQNSQEVNPERKNEKSVVEKQGREKHIFITRIQKSKNIPIELQPYEKSFYEFDHQDQSQNSYQFSTNSSDNNNYDLTQIERHSEGPNTHSLLNEYQDILRDYQFEVSAFTCPHYFNIKGKMVTFIRKGQKLTKLSLKKQISTQIKQKIGIKLVSSKKKDIYFGIESQNQRVKKSEGAARTSNMISSKLIGGKQLHILAGQKGYLPELEKGHCLFMEVDISKGQMVWSIDEEEVKVVKNIPLKGLKWYPFLSFKEEGDVVEFINE